MKLITLLCCALIVIPVSAQKKKKPKKEKKEKTVEVVEDVVKDDVFVVRGDIHCSSVKAVLQFDQTWDEMWKPGVPTRYRFVSLEDSTKAISPVFSDPYGLRIDDACYNGPTEDFMCKMNGKYGMMCYDGTVTLPFEFDEVMEHRYQHKFFRKKGGPWQLKMGSEIRSFEGKTIFRGQVGPYVAIEEGGKIQFMDDDGKMHDSYDLDGLWDNEKDPWPSVVSTEEKYGIVLSNGEYSVKATYDSIFIQERLIVAWMDGKCGVIGKRGAHITPMEYDGFYAPSYARDQIVCQKGDKFGLMSRKDGTILAPIKYKKIKWNWSKKCFNYTDAEGKEGLLSLEGKEIEK